MLPAFLCAEHNQLLGGTSSLPDQIEVNGWL